jgi:hypothetical protein
LSDRSAVLAACRHAWPIPLFALCGEATRSAGKAPFGRSLNIAAGGAWDLSHGTARPMQYIHKEYGIFIKHCQEFSISLHQSRLLWKKM